ncbi:MAG: hypothetical protein ACOVMP_11655 [Chthoniobacterales bacterium]
MKDKAIVVCVEGKRYRASFARIFLPGIRAYATRHGYELFVVPGETIRASFHSTPARTPLATIPSSWLKLFAIQSVQEKGFRRVLFLDADILISPVAEDYFQFLPDETVSAILETNIPESNIRLWRTACGLDPDGASSMVNAGVLYLAGDAGRELIEGVIQRIDEQVDSIDFRNRVFEQPLLSDFLLRHPAFKRMRYTYNTLLYADRGFRMPELQAIRSKVNRLCAIIPAVSRLRRHGFTCLYRLPGRYARGNRKMMRDLLAEGRFIHFAGMNDEQCIAAGFAQANSP